jgi:hypothetical protein
MGIPYQAIGIGIGFLVGIWAIMVAESTRGRVFIAAIMAGIFFMPAVWRRSIAHLISFLAWVVFGISCYIFIKLRGVRIR